ncbi:tetrahydroberberine oxidase-like [Gastrolobium bilobum]|uniref:tetrahydroberberine oxidase-like n=1 Tax=Gastrolobium bilobum TaxID=150636 RepID=UPI002AB15048|nr:tetrahydroberberine oxidase-like [Gastrolobium bilobum]
MTTSIVKLVFISVTIFISIFPTTSTSAVGLENGFLLCFQSALGHNTTSGVIFTKSNSSYEPLLESSIRNSRFLVSSVPKPDLIVTPHNLFQIQLALLCSKKNNLQVRIRSGGHDYEGLSYVSHVPFLIIDLINLRSISINIKEESAWVQSGATLGELYYAIANISKVHGFPAGSCSTIGVGGHFSGGGFGTIFRKYGLASDNVIDAQMVDVNGKILNRTLMGEDLFWAIRGGGGSSFGVITAWKIKLVPVPSTVTIFDVSRTLDQGASSLFHKWQTIAPKLPAELFVHTVLGVANSVVSHGGKTVRVSFTGLYLGTAEELLPLMQNRFPELGLQHNNFTQMTWIQSVLYFAGYSIDESLEVLLVRNKTSSSFKAKSDYVKEPIPLLGLEGLWKMLLLEDSPFLTITPYGGIMSEISESETPFPHRKENLYGIQYFVNLVSNEETPKHIDWIRRLYAYMAPYVSKSPRQAYLNYRDLDLGVNRGNSSYEEAKSWGLKYFNNNFERLAVVKARVDPENFFRDEQSIPPHVLSIRKFKLGSSSRHPNRAKTLSEHSSLCFPKFL